MADNNNTTHFRITYSQYQKNSFLAPSQINLRSSEKRCERIKNTNKYLMYLYILFIEKLETYTKSYHVNISAMFWINNIFF